MGRPTKSSCVDYNKTIIVGIIITIVLEFSLETDAFANIDIAKKQQPYSSKIDISPPSIDSSSPSSKLNFQTIFDDILIDYQKEIDVGCSIYYNDDNPKSTTSLSPSLKDCDFNQRRVGTGLGGPDEAILQNGDSIWQTRSPLLSVEECNDLISEARYIINSGLEQETNKQQQPPKQPTNSELGEARVSEMPKAKEWLRHSLHERFFPLLESRFGIPADEFTLQDALVIGYGCLSGSNGGSKSQPIHRDSSLISLNVALSPRTDYEDGGTFFEALPADSSVIYNEQGNIVCHSGGILHAGRGIASGERWVLVLFCIAKNRPELARRCHKLGIEKLDDGQLEEAKSIFQAGLSLAPNDHMLLTSLGGVYMAEGNQEAAMESLRDAAQAYPHCQKANLALGKMMLSNQRPFAALPYFDAVLDWMDDRDLVYSKATLPPIRAIGFDARVVGSQAALFCAQQAKTQNFEDFPWRTCAEKALNRLKMSLEAAPNDPRILNMITQAESILEA